MKKKVKSDSVRIAREKVMKKGFAIIKIIAILEAVKPYKDFAKIYAIMTIPMDEIKEISAPAIKGFDIIF